MRATLDKLISWTGLLLVVVLIVAGGLLTWASTFINNEVTSQLGGTARHHADHRDRTRRPSRR